MKRFLAAVLGVTIASVPAAGQAAKLYKWVDPDGRVYYQDYPPPPGSGKVEERALEGQARPAAANPLEEIVAKYPVTLYSIPKCTPCDLARLYLQKRKVPFTERNVSAGNADNQKEMLDKVGELVVPTLAVGAKVMKGAYSESLLEGELDQAGYPKAEAAEGDTETAPPAPKQPA